MRYVEQSTWEFFIDNAFKYGFEEREGQQNMALDIVAAIRENQHFLKEAGVGIGKSYAYIVPLLYYHRKTAEPIAIATSTIALQEQLIGDIQKISKSIGHPVEIVLAKGQTHFVCRERAEAFFSDKLDKDSQEILKQLREGRCDRSRFSPEIDSYIWNQINVREYNAGACGRCKDKFKCGYRKLRDCMLNTDGIILCNQDLLTVHLRRLREGQKPLLNEKVVVMVVDEAHNLEEKVRNAYTTRVSKAVAMRRVQDVQRAVFTSDMRFEKAVERYIAGLNKLFAMLERDITEQIRESPVDMKYAERFFFRETKPTLDALSNISTAASKVDELAIIFSDTSNIYGREVKESSEAAMDSFHDVTEFFRGLTSERSKNLFWLEREGGRAAIVSCPKEMAPQIRSLYFHRNFTTILTSATITNTSDGDLAEQYGYFVKNTGFPSEVENGFLGDPEPSPFDYDAHAMLYYCGDLPDPSKEREAFLLAGTERLKELIAISKGRALVLFTAKTDMEEVYRQLTAENPPYKVLMQTQASSQEKVLNEFRDNQSSVLLGTGAYWEGIDIKGESLSNLIIFRLPFPVPDPVTNYKRSQAENPLMNVSVPEMVIKCKQGIGRLIRSAKDRGIAAIIDPRLGEWSTAPYKQVLWDALPIKNRTSDISVLQDFYYRLYP